MNLMTTTRKDGERLVNGSDKEDMTRSYGAEAAARASGMSVSTWRIPKPSVIQVESTKTDLYFGRSDALKSDVIAIDASRPVANFQPLAGSPNSFHSAFRPIILLAQCFSVLPVSGVNSSDANYLKFKWRSGKVVYCAVSFIGSAFLTTCSAIRLYATGITANKTTSLVFVASTCITTLMFFRLATKWSNFALAWERTERGISLKHASKTSLATKFKILTAITMFIALVEHVLSIGNGYISALECAQLRRDIDSVAIYFESQFPQVFALTSYSHWKGFLMQCMNILGTFIWNFMDLFLILLSVALTERFRQLNRRLYSTIGNEMPDWWWAEARKEYNQLATLTRRVDASVSDIVLLSFGTNLYFICIQLLNSLNPMRDVLQTVYFCFSLGFLLARTTAVSLYAASIHDESILPAHVLYSVSEASYSSEVCRFLTQVTTDNLGLTGMKFFSITRGLVLTVAGTIVTYELVLVQFNAVQQADPVATNITDACTVK